MFRAIKVLVGMVFTLVVFAGILAPALNDAISEMASVMPASSAAGISGAFGLTKTVLFLGMPLMFLGGIVLVVGLISVGIRGTSFK